MDEALAPELELLHLFEDGIPFLFFGYVWVLFGFRVVGFGLGV